MKTETPGPADLQVYGLRRRWDLTDEDRFPWSLHPTWNGVDRRPSLVLAVRMGVDWRQEIQVTFECHVLRKDGTPGVKPVDYRLDSTARLDDEGVPGWVRDEHRMMVHLLDEVLEAVTKVQAEHGLTDDA